MKKRLYLAEDRIAHVVSGSSEGAAGREKGEPKEDLS